MDGDRLTPDEITERYGAGTRVPVLGLLSPDTGLDAPPTYTNPPRSIELPMAPPEGITRLEAELAASPQDELLWTSATEKFLR